MKYSKFFVCAMVLFAFACSESPVEEATVKATEPREEAVLTNIPWVYVMDVTRSRTCGIGGGICYENGMGDVLDQSPWWYFGGVSLTDPDVVQVNTDEAGDPAGSVLVALTTSSSGTYEFEMVLTRPGHVDGHVQVPAGDIVCTPQLAAQFGVTSITLHAGSYPIDYSQYPTYGAATIACTVIP